MKELSEQDFLNVFDSFFGGFGTRRSLNNLKKEVEKLKEFPEKVEKLETELQELKDKVIDNWNKLVEEINKINNKIVENWNKGVESRNILMGYINDLQRQINSIPRYRYY